MKAKYSLKTHDSLKCCTCGNKEFEERYVSREGKECWKYLCSDCSHIYDFGAQLEKK